MSSFEHCGSSSEPSVVGIGRADVGVLEGAIRKQSPRHHEQAALVFRYRDDDRDVVANLVPRHRDVHALGGSDRVGIGTLVKGADLVGPHAGSVDDRLGAHGDQPSVYFDDSTCRRTVVAFGQFDDATTIDHHSVVGRCGAGHSEAQTGVVDRGVEVQVGRRQALFRHGRQVGEGRFLLQPAVELADPPPTGEVVHPHRRAERSGDLARHDAVFGEDRNHERQHFHQMGRVAAQPLPFAQCLVDESNLALLQVTNASVNQLGALRRGARGEVVALDESRAEAARRSVEGNPGAGDAAADHQDVE